MIADLNKSMNVDQKSLASDHKTRLYGASQGKLLLVADGMGGHMAGERASQLVVDSIVNYVLDSLQWFFRLGTAVDEDFCEQFKNAVRHYQAVLQAEAKLIPQRRGMGTTLTLAYVIWPRMYVAHAGDSRCYVMRDGKLKQITRDHTLSQLYRESQEAEERVAAATILPPSWLDFRRMMSRTMASRTLRTRLSLTIWARISPFCPIKP